MAAVGYKNEIFVIGGWDGQKALNQCLRYSFSDTKWVNLDSMKFRRNRPCIAVICTLGEH